MNKLIAFVFPGQGSQSIGMLSNLGSHPIIQETFQEASKALNYDVWALTQEGPLETLNQTEYTQPALLTASVALWRYWLSKQGILPKMMAGHSLGEYTALVCAESLELKDAVRLVALRGQLMQAAVPKGTGAMAAILGMTDQAVFDLCEAENQKPGNNAVSPANYNSPGQVVIAGYTEAVLNVMESAKRAGAKRVIQLPVSVPSHCALMKPAAVQLEKALNAVSLKSPTFSILHNVDVSEHPSVSDIKNKLVEQLYQPVRWVETIQAMANRGITTVLECGPGSVLSGLNKRIVSTLQCESLSSGEIVCP